MGIPRGKGGGHGQVSHRAFSPSRSKRVPKLYFFLLFSAQKTRFVQELKVKNLHKTGNLCKIPR
jgi:hypothetical protein